RQQSVEHDDEKSQNGHANENTVGVIGALIIVDEKPQPFGGRDEFSYYRADDREWNARAQTDNDKGQGGRQEDFAHDLPTGRAHDANDRDVVFVHRAQPGKRVDDHDKEHHGHDDGDLGHQADAEPDYEDGRQGDFWDA